MVLRYPDVLFLDPEDPRSKKSYATLIEHAGSSVALHDPIHGGVWCQPQGGGMVGTLTCVVTDNATKKPMLLSNRHVFFEQETGAAGTPIISPPSGRPGSRIIGHRLKKMAPAGITFAKGTNLTAAQISRIPTFYDAATATMAAKYTFDIPGVGIPTGHAEPRVGMNVILAGGKSGVTRGKVTDISENYMTTENAGANKFRYVKNAFIHSAKSTAGDSGSIIVEESTKKVLGLHFAGDDARPAYNIACRASPIASAFGISFVGKPGIFNPNGSLVGSGGGTTPTPTPGGTKEDPVIAFIRKNPVPVAIGGLFIVSLMLLGR